MAEEKEWVICPKCHEYHFETRENMFSHIVTCKDDSDVITTKWYTYEELQKKYNVNIKEFDIIPYFTLATRPQTR
tara:strand:- start:486 stop:710 length:225 start_codon:yes stop_codon:yes gene_type:complete